ncbi:aliphatic sulfonate ABC transporter substrate-binding protein [Nocardioides sp. Soil805]|uniref:aliphatic sulfonate ABC transporter substrate-binding protein n=1 Tax=Nocardioides sp. Soil805 TaxID=1736416 RepID=UPI00070306A0|nr:aliphatic sulfonate ABC transporter substrate-binding protein [Nocardioides sp. Soil805]KRF36817.1 ABC transporter substrate-binding protein [Nocardioides sp. Soil805]
MPRHPRLRTTTALLVAAGTLFTATACAEGEAAETDARALNLDYATYNPLSLVIKDQGWLEDELADQDVEVSWVKSDGSNKANENLRAEAIDIGSTAGSAALLARANGSPIRTVDIFSQPEWAAIVVPEDSDITSVKDLAGTQVAATKGTDPYFFLLQALDAEGVDPSEVTVENLQHADGATALSNGAVDAWAGLDPIMAGAEQSGAKLIYRNIDFNTYGFLNANEDFIADEPELVQLVVDAYDKARQWVQDNPDEAVAILAEEAAIDEEVARTVLTERTNFDFDHVPGQAQLDVLTTVGPIFVESGDVEEQSQIDDALDTLLDDEFAGQADASAVAG